jgi:hypothetical protein
MRYVCSHATSRVAAVRGLAKARGVELDDACAASLHARARLYLARARRAPEGCWLHGRSDTQLARSLARWGGWARQCSAPGAGGRGV